ncbi:hypothetical protein C0993_002077 [Termitomyces sp. T159_Od127]|nr:hypothetical protein C0993_002077 [Termitomyces sp. T159_Od127]
MANDSADLEDIEGSARSYQIRTKLRIIADPRLARENSELLNQLQEERTRVNLLAAQLRQAQNDQVRTAWVTRGIVNGMVEQSNAGHNLRDDALQQLQDVSHERDRLKREYEQHLQQAVEEQQTFEERRRKFQQDLREQERRFQEKRQIMQQALETQNRNHAQTLQAEIDRLQAEHQQHIAESTQAREGLEHRLGEMEAAQSQVESFESELNERLNQERQNLSMQNTTEVRQRLEEQDRNHQQALQSEISRLQAEHQQQLAEATQAREDIESRIRELEQVRAQESNLIEQARLSIQAATRSEEAHETLRNVVSHDSEVITNLQAQLNARNHSNSKVKLPLKLPIVSQPLLKMIVICRILGHMLTLRQQLVKTFQQTLDWLERRHALNMNAAGPSGRRVSFNTASPEETVTPPLRIPRPYSSSNPQTPRLRLATPQPSTPRFNSQPSPLRPSSLAEQAPTSSPPPMFSMHPLTPRHSFVGTSDASSRAASQTPPREIPNRLSSVLTNLAGSVNLLREEMAETRSTFATMNNPPNTSTGFRVTSGLSRRSPYKALSTPRHKDQGRTDMMKIIREAIRIKLAIKHDKDIKTATQNRQHMASPEEVDSFDRGEIPAPTLIPFRPYWDDINCLWNESLANQVLDELFMAGHDFNGETRKDLKDYFFQRLSTLRKELKRQAPRPSETTQQAEQRAETQHQITLARNRLFESRQQICQEGLNKPDRAIWESLLQLVIALQIEGQSSDESNDTEQDLYHVRSRPWRNGQVTDLLKYIDNNRETANNHNRRVGKAFRTRIRLARPPVTQERPIAGLPRNLYDSNFLDTRRQDQLNHLDVQEAIELPEFEEQQLQPGYSRRTMPAQSRHASSRHTTPTRHVYFK